MNSIALTGTPREDPELHEAPSRSVARLAELHDVGAGSGDTQAPIHNIKKKYAAHQSSSD